MSAKGSTSLMDVRYGSDSDLPPYAGLVREASEKRTSGDRRALSQKCQERTSGSGANFIGL